MRRAPVNQGFTIIELAVTMSVIALMMAAAAPSISDWLRNIRIRNQAESIQNGLQRARTEAVRRNEPVTFWLVSLTDNNVMDNNCSVSSTGSSWVVSQDNPANACGATPSTTSAPRLVAAHNAGDGGGTVAIAATLVSTATTAQSATFDGFGRLVNVGTDIQRIAISYPTGSTSSGDRALRVEITPAGQIRMCDPAAGSGDARHCDY